VQSNSTDDYFKRFEKIVEGAHLECPDSIFVEGREEDDGRTGFRGQGVKEFESISPWNLDVEKQQIRLVRRDGGDSLFAVRALCDDLEFRMILQEGANVPPGKQLVMND
jgi:hypothetical protein